MKCKTCKHWFDNGTDLCSCDRVALLREADFFCAAWEQKPVEKVYTVREKPTNADRIRSMSDEELAEFMRSVCDTWYIDANQNWLDWLKSPSEKDGEA